MKRLALLSAILSLRERWSRLAAAALQSAVVPLLAACGGGAGADNGAPPPPAVETPTVEVGTVAKSDPGSALPEGWQHGAFMQVFVRSYQDSDGDGYGDLRGLTQRLDYLRDLGVKGLWLMPVTASQDRDHGYAVTDYRGIEADYGSLADFDELLSQAHARGIGVVVDYVINHSAAKHPLFANARSSTSNPYRNWYVWEPLKPTGWNIYGADPWRSSPGGGWYFAAFWDQMPDFNLREPAVVNWHHDNLRFWLNRGLDGFRLDAVGHLVENGPTAWDNQPQNDALLRDAAALSSSYERRLLVCEGPGDPQRYADACGSAFAFGHHARIVEAAKGSPSAVRAIADYFGSAPATMATMLANHDSFAGQRIYDQFGGNLAQYRLAAATYLLMPGTPFIYYGEEIGMAGAASLGGDPRLRTPMSWTSDGANAGFTVGRPYRALSANVATANVAAQVSDAQSLLSFYKAMLALRNVHPSIARGTYEQALAEGNVLSFRRRHGDELAVVSINYASNAATLVLSALPASATLSTAFPAGHAAVTSDAQGQLTLSLPPRSITVLLHGDR
jgi:glycosidase